MNVKRRRVMYAAIALVIAVLLILAFIPDPIPVETAVVRRGPMTVTIDSRGRTRVRDRYVLVAPVTGRLERVELRDGDAVQEGQIVARIAAAAADPRQSQEIEARIDAARAVEAEAEAAAARVAATLDLARKESARREALSRQGIVSGEDLDRARAMETEAEKELAAARARVAVARSEAAAQRAGLLSTSGQNGPTVDVRAFVAGEVLEVPERSGRLVQAGETILVLGNTRVLELVIELLSQDAVKIRPGAPVIVEEWGGPVALRGRVRLIEPSAYTKISALGIEEQRVDAIADLGDVPPQVGDGFRVEARVIVWQSGNALKVPVSALFRAGDRWEVFVVEDGRARRRPVRAGHRNESEAEILDGVREGERLIVHPPDDIEEGKRVAEAPKR